MPHLYRTREITSCCNCLRDGTKWHGWLSDDVEQCPCRSERQGTQIRFSEVVTMDQRPGILSIPDGSRDPLLSSQMDEQTRNTSSVSVDRPEAEHDRTHALFRSSEDALLQCRAPGDNQGRIGRRLLVTDDSESERAQDPGAT